MNEQLVSQLQDLGLSDKEARVYLANLSLGAAPVQRIADAAGIKRVTGYVILESLVNHGLASQTTKGKKTLFTAEDPASLKRLLDKKQQELKDQMEHFDTLLPELKQVKSMPSDSPEVKFYDSAEGIRALMGTFLAQAKEDGVTMLYGMTNDDQLYAFFPEIKERQANPERIKTGLPSKTLYTFSGGRELQKFDKEHNRESRWVPYEQYPFSGDVSIVGDYVVMLSLSGNHPIGVTIKSKALASTMLGIFNLAWEAAEQYNK